MELIIYLKELSHSNEKNSCLIRKLEKKKKKRRKLMDFERFIEKINNNFEYKTIVKKVLSNEPCIIPQNVKTTFSKSLFS